MLLNFSLLVLPSILLIAALTTSTPSAQPYYPAWAVPVPTLVVLQTTTLTTALVIKQEHINLQCTAHWNCAFCADPSYFMGSCPLVEGYIQARKASQGTNGCLYLPDGWRIPCIQGTWCLCKWLDWLPTSVPALSSSVVTSGIFLVTNSSTDEIFDIEPLVFMAPVDEDSDEKSNPAFIDPDFQACITNAWAAFQANKKDKGK